MKLESLIHERDRLRREWQHNVTARGKIEARLDVLTHDIAALAGLGGLLDVAGGDVLGTRPSMLADSTALLLGGRRRRRI